MVHFLFKLLSHCLLLIVDSLCCSVALTRQLYVTPWTAAHRLPCPLPSPGACSNSCPLSQWCHSTISSSVIPFSCLQSFPALGSFPLSWLFTSGGQSIGASASTSVLPMKIWDWFPLGWTDLISLQSKGLSRVFFSTTIQKHHFFSSLLSLWSSSHICTWLLVLYPRSWPLTLKCWHFWWAYCGSVPKLEDSFIALEFQHNAD